MAQQLFKSPTQQADYLSTPFDTRRISQKKDQTPRSLFQNYRLTQMSPNDYYGIVAHISGYDPQKLMEHRQKNTNEISVQDIRQKMKNGIKFDTPWIRLSDRGEPHTVDPYWQEGLHRMLAAGQEYGMDTKFPVYLAYENDPWEEYEKMSLNDFLNHYDTTRQKRYDLQKEKERIEDEERENFFKQDAADRYGILLENIDDDIMKRYFKDLDNDFLVDDDYY